MEWLFGILIFVTLIGVISRLKEGSKETARRNYKTSLEELKQDPNNPDLRGRTLELGRHYSNLMRDSKGHTIFDEMALSNDIAAACARATVGQYGVGKVEVTNPIALGSTSAAQEIEKLGQLFLQGVLTAEEFERGKTMFLGAPPDKAASAVDLLQNLNSLKVKGVLSESEFNMKKWEILSERLLPGRKQAATLRQPKSDLYPTAGTSPVESLICPVCVKGIPMKTVMPGLNTCPHCQATYEVDLARHSESHGEGPAAQAIGVRRGI
jgi:hypothetical protein